MLWVLIGVFIGATVMATIVCCWIKKGDIEDECD
jgi:hypothetical protein